MIICMFNSQRKQNKLERKEKVARDEINFKDYNNCSKEKDQSINYVNIYLIKLEDLEQYPGEVTKLALNNSSQNRRNKYKQN